MSPIQENFSAVDRRLPMGKSGRLAWTTLLSAWLEQGQGRDWLMLCRESGLVLLTDFVRRFAAASH